MVDYPLKPPQNWDLGTPVTWRSHWLEEIKSEKMCCIFVHFGINLTMALGHFWLKGHSAFPWISAQPLLEPLLNMQTTFYMSVIIYVGMELPHTKGHTSNPLNKRPKRDLITTDGQIPYYWKALSLFCKEHMQCFDASIWCSLSTFLKLLIIGPVKEYYWECRLLKWIVLLFSHWAVILLRMCCSFY